MTTKIVWRLKERPTPLEIIELKKAGLLKEEEAREILFSSETDDDRDKKSLEGEIKFLRDIVQRLSNGTPSTIITAIQDCRRPHLTTYPWYGQYEVWCSNLQNYPTGLSGTNISADGGSNTVNCLSGTTGLATQANSSLQASGSSAPSFTSINTF